MFEQLFILLTAIIFYFIGKYSQTNKEKEIAKTIKDKIKPQNKSIDIIKQKSPEERRKEGTDEEAVENEMSKLLKNIIKK